MNITIQDNINDIRTLKILTKFLNMNDNNFLDKENLVIGENNSSGFVYIYIEDNPSISICLNMQDDFIIVYNSGLDGLEFFSSLDNIETLAQLESKINEIYELENNTRGDDYEDNIKTKLFIKEVEKIGWDLI